MTTKINGTNTAANPAITGADTDTGLSFASDTVNINTGGATRATIDSAGALDVPTTFPIKVNGSEKLRITSSGNVGIGKTPSDRLDVQTTHSSGGRIATFSNSDSGNNGGLIIQGGGSDGEARLQSAGGSSFLTFYTEGGDLAERMRIDSAGALLINNAVNTYPWSATGNVAHGVLLNSRASSVEFPISGNSNNTITCILNRTNGNGRILEFKYNGSVVGNVDSNGSSLPSDRDFKTNISDLNLGLSVVNKLKPSQFNYKIDDANTPVMYGLIAQELEETLTSEGVTKNSTQLIQHHPTDDSESNYSVDYLKLLPILINSIKELSTEVETLKTKVAALEGA